NGDAAHQTFIGDFEETLSSAFDLANRIHAAGIAVPTIDDICDVNVDNITFTQRLIIRNAMANNVIDRGANRLHVTTITKGRWKRSVLFSEFENETVDFICGHAGLYDFNKFIKAASRYLTGSAHRCEIFLAVEANRTSVLQWG